MGGNIPGGNFPGRFSRESLMGGNFPEGNFPRTAKYLGKVFQTLRNFFENGSCLTLLIFKRLRD